MRTYRELFAVPELTPLFVASSLQVAAGTVSGLALGTLVYTTTGSPLLSALSMFGASFGQLVGGLALLSVADRVPPRAAMAVLALTFAAGTLVLALPGMPVWALLAVVLAIGLVNSVGGGIRWGLLTEIVPPDGYVIARSVFNIAVGLVQIGGYALGGALVAWASPRGTLAVAAALYLVAATTVRVGLTRRPPRARDRPSVRRTWQVNASLWSLPARRHTYLALWVPNGLVVGCEALFVPYAPGSAAALFAAGAAGMLAGDLTAGRLLPAAWRPRLITPLRLLLAAPFLLLAVRPPLPVAAVAVGCACVGYGAGLLLQERLVALTPIELRGQALGLHSSGMLTLQAVCATTAGAVAERVGPAAAIATMATASLLVSAALTPALRRAESVTEPVTEPVTDSAAEAAHQ